MFLSFLKNKSQNISPDGSYYYFSRFTDEQKTIYQSLLTGIRSFKKEIKIPLRPVNEISLIFNSMLLDNPLVFYVSSYNQVNDLYKQKCTIVPEYKFTHQVIKQYTNTVNNFLQVFDTVKNKSDSDKELFVHDYCLNNVSYDNGFGDYSYSVLGPVLNKTAVCDGIAKFVKLAFDYLGVKCLVVSGKAQNPAADSKMEGHSWNMVKTGGKTYHLDVTFDMTLKNKTNRYDYFNLCDNDIKKDHVIVTNVPACTTAGNDYYSVNSLSVNSSAELDNYIGKALKQGKKTIVVKIMNVQYSENTVNKIMGIAQRQYGNMHNGSVMIEVEYNSSQMVFEIHFK